MRHRARPASQIDVPEAWILAGMLDGSVAYPRLGDEICGIPHGLRLACDLAAAGAERIVVVWSSDAPLPDLSKIASDRRFARPLEVVRAPPRGDDTDEVIVVRSDRLFHRDLPKLARKARRHAQVGKVRGCEHDAVFATDRATARRLTARADEAGGIADVLGSLTCAETDAPYAGFTARASGPGSLRRAERQLVWSLRKAADGIASKAINRHLSLPISWALSRTGVHPNHITLTALVLALAGALTIATGGYLAGVAGMLLVELGSIIDGCDGELARLRFQLSRTGQWLDTTVDDFANIAYVTGIVVSLDAIGTTWAKPLGMIALGAFVLTQITQYALITLVYKSGDLAAIPWAFQSAGSLAKTTFAATLPKLFKRDFAITLFVGFAILGRLDWILVGFSAGAIGFFAVFFVQLARNARRLTS